MTDVSRWQVGQLVQVQARTWPGINQPGGVGRITGCNNDGTRVAVRYVLDGRHEKEIEVKYVEPYGQGDQSRLRDRSMLLGRCQNCGSLRSDCGSCDIQIQFLPRDGFSTRRRRLEKLQQSQQPQPQQPRLLSPERQGWHSEAESNLSSTDDDSVDEILQNTKKLESQSRKLKRMWKRSKQVWGPDSSSSDDDKMAPFSFRSRHADDVPTVQVCTENKHNESVGDQESSSDDESESDDSIILRALMAPRRRRRKGRDVAVTSLTTTRSPSKHHTISSPRDRRKDIFSDHEEAGDHHCKDDHDDCDANDPFIQPEGRADTLPSDVEDESKHVSYTELPSFVDELVKKLEEDELPSARRQLVALEREAQSTQRSADLAVRVDATYTNWIGQLVRRGIDQCQAALRKISTQYRRWKADIPTSARHDFRGTGFELRETRVDNLSRDVEEVMARLRQLGREIKGLDDEDMVVQEEQDDDDDDGWVDPYTQQTLSPTGKLSFSSPLSERTFTETGHSELDPHEHAYRGRRPAASRMGRFVEDRRTSTLSNATNQLRPAENGGRTKNSKSRESDGHLSFDGAHQDRYSADSETSRRKRAIGSTAEDSILAEIDKARPKRRKNATSIPTSLDPCSDPAQVRKRSSLPNVCSAPEQQTERTAPNEEPVLKRMERFLQANGLDQEGDGDSIDLDIQSPTFSRLPAKQRRLEQRRRKKQAKRDFEGNSGRQASDRNRGYTTNGSLLNGSSRIKTLREELFLQLRSSPGSRSAPRDFVDESSEDSLQSSYPMELCNCIVDEFNSIRGRNALATLARLCRSDQFHHSHNAKNIFSALWASVKKNGNQTLQYYFALKPDDLDEQVSLHVATLDAMKGLQNVENEYVRETMSPVAPLDYLNLLVLQFVELSLAILLPQAWGMPLRDYTRVWSQLETLRRGLSDHCNLLECCCKCIVDQLHMQTWVVSLDSENAYISSMQPTLWLDFLKTGKLEPQADTSNLRYRHFQGKLPQCEADALWTLIAFVGVGSATDGEAAPCTRRLLSSLFSRGSLAEVHIEPALPPSPLQVAACTGELKNLASFLQPRIVGGATIKDSFLTNVIKRSIYLYADFFGGVAEARSILSPTNTKDCDSWGKLKILRKHFSAYSIKGEGGLPEVVEKANAVDLFDVELSFLKQHEVLPSSEILRNCLELFVRWHGMLPRKRVRYNNFEKTKNVLMASFVKEGRVEPEKIQDAFHLAFSSRTPAQSGISNQRRSILLFEAAAYFEIFHGLLLGCVDELPTGVTQASSLTILQKVWDLLADTNMKEVRMQVVSGIDLSKRTSHLSDPYRLFICSRAVAFVGFLSEGFWPSGGENGYKHLAKSILDEIQLSEARDFSLSCLLSCFDIACDSLASVEVACFICHRIVVYLYQTCKTSKFSKNRQSALRLHPAILGKLEATCVTCIQKILSSSHCGTEEDMLFSLVLLTVDLITFHSSCSFGESRKEECSELSDDWEGLDDSWFAAIDVEKHSHQSNERTFDFVSILINSMLESRPSLRYTTQSNGTGISVQGRMLVARRFKFMCRTLSFQIASAQNTKVFERISVFWEVSCVCSEADVENISYLREVSFALLGELCQMMESDVFQGKMPPSIGSEMVPKTLEYLLESSVISKFPSEDIAAGVLKDRLQKSAEKEIILYRSLQRGGLNSLRKKAGRSWFVCRVLARTPEVFSACSTNYLEAFSGAFAQNETLLITIAPSLEHEIIRRLHFVLSFLRLCEDGPTYETLAATTLCVLSSEILAILQRITSQADSSYEQIKDLNLAKAYVELYVFLVVNILLQNSKHRQSSLQNLIVNDFLIPVLSGKRRTSEILSMCRISESILNVKSNRSKPFELSEDLHEYFVDTLHRRSRHVGGWIANEIIRGRRGLTDELLEAVLKSVSDKVSASRICQGIIFFDLHSGTLYDDKESTLSLEIGKLSFPSVPSELIDSEPGTKTILLRYVLSDTIATKLRRSHVKPEDRVLRLSFVEAALNRLRLEASERTWMIDALTLASVGSGIICSLWYTLSSNIACDEVLEYSFRCASALFGLPSRLMRERNVGWISDWSIDVLNIDDSENNLPRQYLGSVMDLLSRIGTALGDRSDLGRSKLNEFRRKLKESERGIWPSFSSTETHSRLEKKLGFRDAIGSRKLINIYAEPKGSSEFVDFVANENILSAIRHFRNVVRRN